MEVAYSVDLLFYTDNENEPGSMHVKVLSPKKITVLSVLIEVDSGIQIQKNLDAMVKMIQQELFNRIKTDVKNEINMYFVVPEDQKNDFDGSQYVKAVFNDMNCLFEKVDEIIY